MTQLGKIGRGVFESVIAPDLGAERDDVTIDPKHGIDFGMLEIGDAAVAISTDPISILPALGFQAAGRFAIEFVLADVAVSGIAPSHLAVSFTLPPAMTDAEFGDLWQGIADRARELGVRISAGHTARYSSASYSWIGAGTALGIGSFDDIVRPDGAQPGDELILTGVPGGEVAGLFATVFPDELSLPDETRRVARGRLEAIETVEDAIEIARSAPVSAIHDVTEGGIAAGLNEMARTASVRFDIDRDAVRIPTDVTRVCSMIDVDPWQVTSAGTLLVAVPDAGGSSVVSAMESRGTPAAIVGTVSDGDGVFVDGNRINAPDTDPSWQAFADLTNTA